MALIGTFTSPSSSVTTALGYTPANKAGDTFTGSITVPGMFNSLNAGNRKQVWSHSGLLIANGASADIIRNRGGYSRALVELFVQSQHGSNGYYYRMYQLSRYGLDNVVVASAGSMDYTSVSLNASTNDNAIRFSVSGYAPGVNFPMFVVVHYMGSETGIEFDSPAGLTRIE